MIPEAPVFRLERPGAVLYFRGYPHVHAFINIAMDGDALLSSGEHLADNATTTLMVAVIYATAQTIGTLGPSCG